MFSQELQLPLTPEHGWGGKLRSQRQGKLPYHLAGVCTTLFSVNTGFQALKLCFEFCIQDKSKTSEQLQSKGAD